MGGLLVERQGADDRLPAAQVMVVPGTGRVTAEADLADEPRAIALAHSVARRPSDARTHVERINHHLTGGDHDGVYGALVDLFIAFDAGASALRRRMLHGSRHLLTDGQLAVLLDAIEDGLRPTDPMEPAVWSVLSAGVCGAVVVERLDGDLEHHGSRTAPRVEARCAGQRALEIARAAVRRGDLSAASGELQAAVLSDPSDELVQAALVDLFRHAGEVQPVREFVALLPAGVSARRWQLLIEELSL